MALGGITSFKFSPPIMLLPTPGSGPSIALNELKETITMPDETDRPALPETRDDSSDSQKAVQEKLERVAEKAAKRAGKREQRYDGEHGIFTK
jgi:hypothetical protein